MLRAIREIKPRFVVGENVGGLISWNGGLVFDEVQSDLEAEGYEVQAFVLPACAVDAPHRRDRVWIIAKNTKSSRCVQRKLEKGFAGIWGQWDACAGSTERVHLQARSTSNSDSIGWIQSNSKPKSGQLAQNIPDWRGFPTQSPVCGRNDGVSTGLAGITVPKHRRESLKAYGNAIVPQVAYQIFKAIQETEN